ncbi:MULTISPECIES: RNA polymerase sigma factor [Sphingobacterium]|uniref:Sigma-70 family RNA polymerase sigma factor n=1 Tax=Sphingobacterium kitahiroshimense TaxID=470446 RepID=A0ABV0BW47_9SPHI|nr:sigma-70 family RNA polymerase sigma factor [Sphingobacterium sp. JUb56]MBB2949983.1 RNA polymerase sigma-70 factor (ECF subfamily) [Sphingobacterium sp. JUb56]
MENVSTQKKEEELYLQLFRSGEPEGLRFLYKTFYGAMCFYLEKMHLDSYKVEELVQDVFIKLWDRHKDFDHFSAIRSFLYTSCRNAALNLIHKEKRQQEQIKSYISQLDILEWPVSNQIIYLETLREIHEAIFALPEQCSKIMSMLTIEELSPQEVADALGITTSTVYNQKKRAIDLLQLRLTRDQFFCFMLLSATVIHTF